MKRGTCLKCGSRYVMGGLPVKPQVTEGFAHGSLGVPVVPASGLLRVVEQHQMHAWSCASCGYTELYLDNPGLLYQRLQQEGQQPDF